ncbi:hypothetical protein SAMN05444167_0532 [Terriglobus roseus]|uniref:Uncharacterized protein n=1 Tax=Terriglobus roseus TaxID=392734 RepID=A0A1G7G2N0_9BACT|nr:hypothetical protein SAMN05444167_0532 [Terriglobus roseus]
MSHFLRVALRAALLLFAVRDGDLLRRIRTSGLTCDRKVPNDSDTEKILNIPQYVGRITDAIGIYGTSLHFQSSLDVF